ncbi:hypothetical protein JYU34_009921 [Plutella xylostella]|uniref:Carboxylic ester hydrolase n=1 Tax=Plutella xylostella TaxID=51655 RepID=A0ABQ7QKM1_PLUXY|nr:hypothetical protein JYU34_009921 [Plutella xylostella]
MVVVNVTEGALEGEVLNNIIGGKYYSFKGIPYAAPPIGDLRFKPPQPLKPWSGVRSALKHGPNCHQYDNLMKMVIPGSEDCLYLNVYTKDIKPSKPLPVMIFIHGGAFVSGSGDSDWYAPDFLVDKDVVLVTINYRLEILGFLCLDLEEAPGNAGMKDQVAAMRWVKKNIHNFGGDPENITIFGESAGGASVSFHLVSPMSKGLFKRAIVQSGNSNAGWTTAPFYKEKARNLARLLGKEDTDDDRELLEFFKSQPIDNLINKIPNIAFFEKEKPWINLHWLIVSERQFGNNERFFTGKCTDILSNGIHEGVEVIIGHTADEALMYFSTKRPLEEIINAANNYLESFVSDEFAWNVSIPKQLKIGEKVKKYYFGNEKVTRENLGPLVRIVSMVIFMYPAVQMVKAIAAKKSKVYFYQFNCHTERNIFEKLLKIEHILPGKKSVLHADDLFYLFNTDLNEPIDKSKPSYKCIDTVSKLWTNFAKYGNPTPDDSLGDKWVPFTLEKQDYLEINEKLLSRSFPDKEEIEFWESLYRQDLPQYCAIK